MNSTIEIQVISKILTSDDEELVSELCSYDSSYYAVFNKQIEFILDHLAKFGNVPDVFTFNAEFPTINLVEVTREPREFLVTELRKNKQRLLLVDTFNKLKDLGSADVTDAWEFLHQQCDASDQLIGNAPMNIIAQAKERAEQVKLWAKQQRIPTGFAELDKLTYGGWSTVEELVALVASTNSGKAQPLWSKVLTPSGWIRMGDIKVGDTVVGENNDNGKVVKIFPQGEVDYYRVHFSDGTYSECCGNHLWKVLDRNRRIRKNKQYGQHMVLTLDQMLKDYKDKKYSVDLTEPVEFESDFDVDAELDGYLLGVIIGDGGLRDNTVTISNESEEIWRRIESVLPKYHCHRSEKRTGNISIVGDDGKVNYIKQKLREYGLMAEKSIDKFIPKRYLTAPVSVRMSLLAGLVDTDGYMPKDTTMVWEFDTASEQLAQDFAELARSLGVFVKIYAREDSYYTKDGIRHQAHGSRHMDCRSKFNPFWYSAKAARFQYKEATVNGTAPKRHCKMIQDIEYMGKTECQCIMLDNVTHTYLTDDYTITHNTWVCTKMMEAAHKAGFPVAFYSPEMQSSYVATRFDTWRAHFKNSELFQGKYTDDYETYIETLRNDPTPAFIIEDKDMPDGVSPRHLGTFIKKNKIKLLIIDGISYMSDDHKASSDYERLTHIAKDLFNISKKYGCAIVVAVQANRETKDAKDEKGVPFPSIYNVAGSFSIVQIATQAYAMRQIFDKHVFELKLEKTRMAKNDKNILSYSWDVNTGNMQYMQGDQAEDPMIATPDPVNILPTSNGPVPDIIADLNLDDLDDEIEF